jgi:hypothetical protein
LPIRFKRLSAQRLPIENSLDRFWIAHCRSATSDRTEMSLGSIRDRKRARREAIQLSINSRWTWLWLVSIVRVKVIAHKQIQGMAPKFGTPLGVMTGTFSEKG